MGDINAACEALATAVSNIDGLRAKAYVDDQINPPEAQVFNRSFDPRLTMQGTSQAVALGLRVFVKRTDLRTAQVLLRDYMEHEGASSIRATVENDTYWPSDVHYVELIQIGQPFETTTGDAVYLAADFDIDIVL